MRDFTVSNTEKAFVLQALMENKRVDGRRCEEFRDLKITFGLEYGSCFVKLGNTKVFCQVSGEIITPKPVRPTDGEVMICVEMSTMAAPHFETGRGSPEGIELTRLLERCIKEARCVDTESLCIIGGEKVWQIRVDVHIIDHDGSLIDCASVAAMAALMHFRRPDITVTGEEFIVHSFEEKSPLPLNVYHMPICITFGFIDNGKCILEDTSCLEEKILDGKMVIAMNSHREVCTMHCTGNMLLKKDLLLSCSRKVFTRVQFVTAQIKEALAEDTKLKVAKKPRGFNKLIGTNRVTTFAREMVTFKQPIFNANDYPSFPTKETKDEKSDTSVVRRGKVVAIPSVSTANRFDRLMNEPDAEEDDLSSDEDDEVIALDSDMAGIGNEVEEIQIVDDDDEDESAPSTSSGAIKTDQMEMDSEMNVQEKQPLAAQNKGEPSLGQTDQKEARNKARKKLKEELKPEPVDEVVGEDRSERRRRRRGAVERMLPTAPADVQALLDDIEEDVMILQPEEMSGSVKFEPGIPSLELNGNENSKIKRKKAHKK